MKRVSFRFPKPADLLKRRWLHAPVMRYVLATVATIVALLIRRALDPWLGNSAAFVTIFPVIAFSAYFLGLGPAALSIVVGWFGVKYFVLVPEKTFSLTPFGYAISLANEAAAAVLIMAVALASRRSYRRLQQFEAALRASEAKLAEKATKDALIEERNRFSREIHDTCAQSFTAIILKLEVADETLSENLEDARGYIISARDLARESLREVRAWVWNLRSDSVANKDLPKAIEDFVQKTLLGVKIEVSVSSQGIVRELPKQIEFGLLRICQEAVTNVVKHANASKVRVELLYEPSRVQLCVQDDGRGFSVESSRTRGFGLTSMQERVDGIGAKWLISSVPARGTRIQVFVQVPTHVARESKYETA
jgi:signal transduction histidine kinase